MRRKDRQVTQKEEILGILSRADACRVGFAAENIPYIVCMNYGYEWINENPVLYFHCAHEGKKIDLLKQNNYVCFQMDTDHVLDFNAEKQYCTMDYSSITGMGYLEIVEDISERKKGLDLLMAHHGHNFPGDYPDSSLVRTTVLRLKVTEITAKQKPVKTVTE